MSKIGGRIKKVPYTRRKADYEIIDKYIDKHMKLSKTKYFPPIKNLSKQKVTRSTSKPIKNFEALMEGVREKFLRGGYQDNITQLKERQRKFQGISNAFQPEISINSDSDSDDDILERQIFVESVLYKRYPQFAIKREYLAAISYIRFLRISQISGTLLALNIISKMDNVSVPFVQAVEDTNAITLFLNILEYKDTRCQIAAMKLLRTMCVIQKVCQSIVELNGVKSLIENLKVISLDVRALAADILFHIGNSRSGRSMIRFNNGIPFIVNLLSYDINLITKKDNIRLTIQGKVLQSAITALWNVSKSTLNRIEMREAGIFPLLSKLLKSGNPKVLVPVMGTLQQCADDQFYKMSIRTDGMIETIVKSLNSKNLWLKTQCGLLIFSCSDDPQMQIELGRTGCLKKIASMYNSETDLYLLYGLTGTIWNCAKFRENVLYFQSIHMPKNLVRKLKTMPQKLIKYLSTPYTASNALRQLDYIRWIAINITGALSELCKIPECRQEILENDGMEPLLVLLLATDRRLLLINTIRTLEKLCESQQGIVELEEQGGIRQLFTLLEHPKLEIKECAAWALVPYMKNTKNLGLVLRSYVGGIEMVIDLLSGDDEDVLAAACSCVCVMSNEPDIVNIMKDLDAVALLTRLAATKSPVLMFYACEAIAQMAKKNVENAALFGRKGAIPYLINFLKHGEGRVVNGLCNALFQLSRIPINCREMHKLGLTKFLTDQSQLGHLALNYDVIGTLDNIRYLVITK